MLYFLDSADINVIRTALTDYPLDGVTTNPAILARDLSADCPLIDRLLEIRQLTDGLLLFVQTTAHDADGMIGDAHAICRTLGGRLSIKLPATAEGFKAAMILKGQGISVTMTAVYTTSQAMLAGKCGADFAAPYISHLDNLSQDGEAVAAQMARQLAFHGMRTQVLAASFRTAAQVERVISGGVTAVTVTGDMLDVLASHPGTAQECAMFDEKWGARFDRGISELLT